MGISISNKSHCYIAIDANLIAVLIDIVVWPGPGVDKVQVVTVMSKPPGKSLPHWKDLPVWLHSEHDEFIQVTECLLLEEWQRGTGVSGCKTGCWWLALGTQLSELVIRSLEDMSHPQKCFLQPSRWPAGFLLPPQPQQQGVFSQI